VARRKQTNSKPSSDDNIIDYLDGRLQGKKRLKVWLYEALRYLIEHRGEELTMQQLMERFISEKSRRQLGHRERELDTARDLLNANRVDGLELPEGWKLHRERLDGGRFDYPNYSYVLRTWAKRADGTYL
jgi:hypothetical protein